MDIVTQPTDYSAGIAQGQGLAFNPLEAQLANAKVDLAQSAAQGQQIQNAAQMQALRMQQIELQRRQQFGQDMQGFVTNPSAEGLASLVGRYPEFASDAENAWGTLDAAERRSTATQLGSVAALVAKGDTDSAIELVKNRIDADQKAGRDSSTAQQMLGLLQSGDPTKVRSVIGVATVLAGGAVGFDKAKDFLDGLGLSQAPVKLAPGEQLVSPQTGDKIAGVAPALTPVTVTNADGSQTAAPFNSQTGAFGAAAVSGAPAPDGAPAATGAAPAPAAGGITPAAQAAIGQVLHNEGGWNPQDMNGAPTMMGLNLKANPPSVLAKYGITNPKQMTADQAAAVYYDRYWKPSGAENLPANLQTPYFDVYVRNPALAKTALAKSGGDPAKFMQIASGYFQKLATTAKGQKYAKAWANRDAANTAMATGAAASGGPAAAPAGGGAPAAQASPYEFGGAQPGVLNTKGAEPGHAWNSTHTAQIPVPGTDADPNAYSSEVEPAADVWLLTNQFPTGSGGMGGGGQLTLGEKNAIVKRAMAKWEALGHSAAELPALRQKYSADSSAYGNITGIVNSLQASENALHANAQQVLKTQAPLIQMGVIKDGVPQWVNSGALEANHWLGSGPQGDKVRASIKAYRDAVNAFSQEYSKFMTAANGVGGSAAPSDSAREAAAELNDESMGPTTLKQHLSQVLTEAANRRAGFAHQQAALEQRLGGYLKGGQAAGGAVHVNSLADYNGLKPGTHYIDPDGVARVKR